MVKGTFKEVLQECEGMKPETMDKVMDKLRSFGYARDPYNKYHLFIPGFFIPGFATHVIEIGYIPQSKKFVVRLNSGYVDTQHIQNIKDELDTATVHANQLNAIIEEEV